MPRERQAWFISSRSPGNSAKGKRLRFVKPVMDRSSFFVGKNGFRSLGWYVKHFFVFFCLENHIHFYFLSFCGFFLSLLLRVVIVVVLLTLVLPGVVSGGWAQVPSAQN